MPPVPRRLVAVLLLLAVLLVLPAGAAAQTSTIPEDGAGVSTTPPVPLPGDRPQPSSAEELPDTGADARLLFLAGLALTLIGFGLRLRTADADDY
ncbi:MAG TPA: LPXTG cell wall anchor domain-containing protein [Solirubrobacteraceae bacterium]|nr:LPXTG cell wall anchor domain-containing protein [Solirubrobacteraceae bacterium]